MKLYISPDEARGTRWPTMAAARAAAAQLHAECPGEFECDLTPHAYVPATGECESCGVWVYSDGQLVGELVQK